MAQIAREARRCMALECSAHFAEDCTCEANRMTPWEFAEWLELHSRMEPNGGRVTIGTIRGVRRENGASV